MKTNRTETQCDGLYKEFSKMEQDEEREERTTAQELRNYLAEFIRSFRRKNAEDYEPSSLLSRLQHLKAFEKVTIQ